MAKQELSFDAIMASLKARQFAPVYLLMGEEGYFIDQISNYIIDHILTNEEKEFNLLYEPWICVLKSDGTQTELSLLEVL